MARPLRLFVDARLAGPTRLTLGREQAHRIQTVMRRRVGDPLLLFNGEDGEWRASVANVAKHALAVDVIEQARPQLVEPGPTLWFAPLKRARQDLLLEKATELGVRALRPVVMRRSVVEKVNLGRQRAILMEAAEQCGRLTIPAIEPPASFDAVLAAAARRAVLWADEALARGSPDDRPAPLLSALRHHADADLLIGPEGGFDQDEQARLDAAPGVVRVSLGPRILRAETAALTMLACWQALHLACAGAPDPSS